MAEQCPDSRTAEPLRRFKIREIIDREQRTRRFLDSELEPLGPTPPDPRAEVPHGPALPLSGYALAATRHMYLYGTTSEQLARAA